MGKIEERKAYLVDLDHVRTEREQRQRLEKATLRQALKDRKIITRITEHPPEIPEASIALDDPVDATSSLSFPVMLLYPAHAQTDFIKTFKEDECLNDHLSYILPLPWDEHHEYSIANVECYMETLEGGLIKAGKNLPLLKLLNSGKLEVVDGLVRVSVLPKQKVAEWIEDFKKQRGRQ